MKKTRNQDFVLGLTTLVVIALLVSTVLFIYPLLRGGGREIVVYFDHERGMAPLKEGSPVILGGALTVGSVTHVEIHQIEPTAQSGRKHPETVFAVRAEISPDVPLYGGCKITTDQPAIGGSGSVSILHVGVPGRELEQPIHGLPPQSLAAAISTLSRELLKEGGLVSQLNKAVDPEAPGSVLHKVLRSLDDVNAITASLRTEMNDNEQKALLGKIHASLDDLNGMTHILRGQMRPDNDAALLGKVHVALDHLAEGLSEAVATLKEDRPLVREALTSVRDVARSLDTELVASLRRELDSADKTSLLGKVHTGMDRVNAALADLNRLPPPASASSRSASPRSSALCRISRT